MSVLLLIRHAQASFGKRDYDALSDRGHEQSRVLGAALAARGVQPTLIVTGAQQRHGQTVEGILSALVDAGAEEPPVMRAGTSSTSTTSCRCTSRFTGRRR